MKAVAPGQFWQHKSGNWYRVIMITNYTATKSDSYPITVVYESTDGSVWSRPLSDWHRSMTKVEDVE